MTSKPRIFGADYSVYVRIARLALLEKNIDHELVPIDVFSEKGLPNWYLEYHPFGRIPAFEHGEFRLFETTAITRYIDEAFPGPELQPSGASQRARMNQIIGLLDSYAYRTLVWDVYVESVSKPRKGEVPDQQKVRSALIKADACLATLSKLKGQEPWLIGESITLADLHAAPMFSYFIKSPEGRAMLEKHPALLAWWGAISARASFKLTEPTS